MSGNAIDQSVTSRLTELRAALEEARSMPMSASAVVNRAEVLGLVDRVEEALQHAFADAGEVVGERASVVASGSGGGRRDPAAGEVRERAARR